MIFNLYPLFNIWPPIYPNFLEKNKEVKTFMKFIISSYSPNMIQANDFSLDWHSLSEEFQALIYDAYSCVGHEDIANAINVAHNKEPVHARIGDILLYANMERGVLKFYCILICNSIRDLVREEELLEEMI